MEVFISYEKIDCFNQFELSIYMYVYKFEMKSSSDDIIYAVDDFFDQWDPNTAIPMEKMCGPQQGLC